MSADLAAFIFGLLAGGFGTWFYLRDRIKAREKKRVFCEIHDCGWKTEESVPKDEGERLLQEHVVVKHRWTRVPE